MNYKEAPGFGDETTCPPGHPCDPRTDDSVPDENLVAHEVLMLVEGGEGKFWETVSDDLDSLYEFYCRMADLAVRSVSPDEATAQTSVFANELFTVLDAAIYTELKDEAIENLRERI